MTHTSEPSSVGELVGIAIVLAAASVSPLMFVATAAGYSSMNWLGLHALLPAVIAVFLVWVLAITRGWARLARGVPTALVAGVLATVGLEIVRLIGFRLFDAMPGSMPELMGVKLLDQFMSGPDALSNLAGWGDHFWNGASFAMIYILILGRRAWWIGTLYALGIGTIFMLSPVMSGIGAGLFGQQYAPIAFPLTVYIAHITFGTVLGITVSRSHVMRATLLTYLMDLMSRSSAGQVER